MVDPEAQEQYWSNAVKRTEEMLDEVYGRLKATHGEFVNQTLGPIPMTRKIQPPDEPTH